MRTPLLLLTLLALPFAGVAQKASKKSSSAVTAPAPAASVEKRKATPPPASTADAPSVGEAASVAPPAPPAPPKAKELDAPEGFKKYYFILMQKGPKTTQDEETVSRITADHRDYVAQLAKDGNGLIDMTFMDKGSLRGFLLVRAPEIAAVKKMADADPLVRAGRVTYEIHPCMTQSTIFEQGAMAPPAALDPEKAAQREKEATDKKLQGNQSH